MSLPYFSIDLKAKDFLRIFFDIAFPFNKKKIEQKLKKKLEERYPEKNILFLPSGRLGFYLTLKYLFKPNDLILFSAMSFPLYIKIAIELGLKVKLVDVDKLDLNIDLDKLEKNLDNNCKGLVVTHLFGNPCNIEAIKNLCEKKNIYLIEDCAQSFNSKSSGIETGNFGDAGIISCSLLKIPTFLSGGMLVTKNKELYEKSKEWCENNLGNNLRDKFKIFIKTFMFILNSYPFIYSILSDKIFSFLKKYNPRIYRKILYSGMGMASAQFNPRERPNLSKYQLSIGLSQIERCEEMNLKRRENSRHLQRSLEEIDNIDVINDHFVNNWNHQYFVICIKENFENVLTKLFNSGIHAMDENVWDCSSYKFELENKNEIFENVNFYNGKLLRLQNNSLLSKSKINKIIKNLKIACEN